MRSEQNNGVGRGTNWLLSLRSFAVLLALLGACTGGAQPQPPATHDSEGNADAGYVSGSNCPSSDGGLDTDAGAKECDDDAGTPDAD